MSSQYFPPNIVGISNNVKVLLDLSGYLRKDGIHYFERKDYFQEEGLQGYFIFYPSYKYFKVENSKAFWKSKGISNEEITSITATSTDGRYSSMSQYLPKLISDDEKLKLKLLKLSMKQAKVTYNHEKIVYKLISSAVNTDTA